MNTPNSNFTIRMYNLVLIIFIICSVNVSKSATVNITVADFNFIPSVVNVDIGDSVKWTLTGSNISSVTCNGIYPGTSLPAGALPWNVILDNENTEYIYVVRVSGIYNYLSVLNSSLMTGTITVDNLLPVELTDFVATTIKNEVILDWTTSGEMNNDRFEIQRIDITNQKSDNPEDLLFETIGHLTGNGTTNNLLTYKFIDRNLKSGLYMYRLKQIDFNSNYRFHLLNDKITVGIPSVFNLSQNYPNPFNPFTKIDFEIPVNGFVKLKIYDINGKVISTIVNEFVSAGYQSTDFNGADFSSGVYFYVMEFTSDNFSQSFVKRMILVK